MWRIQTNTEKYFSCGDEIPDVSTSCPPERKPARAETQLTSDQILMTNTSPSKQDGSSRSTFYAEMVQKTLYGVTFPLIAVRWDDSRKNALPWTNM